MTSHGTGRRQAVHRLDDRGARSAPRSARRSRPARRLRPRRTAFPFAAKIADEQRRVALARSTCAVPVLPATGISVEREALERRGSRFPCDCATAPWNPAMIVARHGGVEVQAADRLRCRSSRSASRPRSATFVLDVRAATTCRRSRTRRTRWRAATASTQVALTDRREDVVARVPAALSSCSFLVL